MSNLGTMRLASGHSLNVTVFSCRALRAGHGVNRAKSYLLLNDMVGHSDLALKRLCHGKILVELEQDDCVDVSVQDEKDGVEYIAQCAAVLLGRLVLKGQSLLVKLADAVIAIRGRKHPSSSQARELRDVAVAMEILPQQRL